MTRKSRYDYGRCHVCGGRMVERCVKQDLWIKEELVVIEGLPAGVCTQCGERVVKDDVGRQVAAMISAPDLKRRGKKFAVRVIPFAKEVA